MSNKNKNLIVVYSFGTLAILALGFLAIAPTDAYAAVDNPGKFRGYNQGEYGIGAIPNLTNYNSGGAPYDGYNYGQYGQGSIPNLNDNGSSAVVQSNAAPVIYSLSPDAKESGSSGTTISVIGDNFNKDSIVKWNSEDRSAIFVSSSHLAVKLTEEDLSGTGEYLITVFNRAPGGGYSNAMIFTLSGAGSVTGDSDGNNLAGSAILAGSFRPFTLMNWLMLAILILLLVILWRKIYVTDKDRQAPLKHA